MSRQTAHPLRTLRAAAADLPGVRSRRNSIHFEHLMSLRYLTASPLLRAAFVLSLGSPALIVACGDGQSGADESGGTGGDGGTDGPGGTGGAGHGGQGGSSSNFEQPLYAMMIQVYDTEDRTVYAHLSDSLELDEIDLTQAREFASVANFVPYDGRLLVSSGLAPTITEYEVTDDFEWIEGRSIGFAGFPVGDNANLFGHFFLDEHTAFMPYGVTSRVIWDPAEMQISGTAENSELELFRGDLMLENAGNRNSITFESGESQQIFFYITEDWFRFGPESILAFYDRTTLEETRTVTIPCPGLSIGTRDEEGYTYYGTWSSPVTLALFGEGPMPCNARVTPEGALDEAWTTDFREWTDGRFVNNFRYIGNGRAIASVLHHDEMDVDWDAGYDPDVADLVSNGGYWHLWLLDLEAETARPIEGIDVSMGEGVQFAVLEGRTFVFLPYDQWARTRIYEIDETGAATERADTIGDVFKWMRVR